MISPYDRMDSKLKPLTPKEPLIENEQTARKVRSKLPKYSKYKKKRFTGINVIMSDS